MFASLIDNIANVWKASKLRLHLRIKKQIVKQMKMSNFGSDNVINMAHLVIHYSVKKICDWMILQQTGGRRCTAPTQQRTRVFTKTSVGDCNQDRFF